MARARLRGCPHLCFSQTLKPDFIASTATLKIKTKTYTISNIFIVLMHIQKLVLGILLVAYQSIYLVIPAHVCSHVGLHVFLSSTDGVTNYVSIKQLHL